MPGSLTEQEFKSQTNPFLLCVFLFNTVFTLIRWVKNCFVTTVLNLFVDAMPIYTKLAAEPVANSMHMYT